ncbi:hypothetical protein FHG87_000900 [Trinorchestia longiramus]|nr:hypothetical protein FHG87_000900 [Trinorchestia longiramus]
MKSEKEASEDRCLMRRAAVHEKQREAHLQHELIRDHSSRQEARLLSSAAVSVTAWTSRRKHEELEFGVSHRAWKIQHRLCYVTPVLQCNTGSAMQHRLCYATPALQCNACSAMQRLLCNAIPPL